MKRSSLYLAVLLAAVISLTACGSGTDSTTSAGSAASAEGSAAEENAGTQSELTPEEEAAEAVEPSEPSTSYEITTYTVSGVDFTMIPVEAGTFTMGSDSADTTYSEAPAHEVTLTEDYLLGETEVTEALWNAVMGIEGGSETLPKTGITWEEAHTFAEKLTGQAQAEGVLPDTMQFCLPTEAQWEYAAKGGSYSQGYLYAGSDNIDEVAVTLENSGSNTPIAVKSRQCNELGLFDMSGNAYEWVDDYAGDYSAEAQTDPQNTTVSDQYVKRGGSNYHSAETESCLFTTTGRYFYSGTDDTIGMRLCLMRV